MAKINLLPWREELREQRKQEFIQVIVGVVVLAGVMVFAWGYFEDGRTDDQKRRNNFLQGEIVQLDQRIAEIADLRDNKEQMLARMQVIQDLQGNRPVIVRVFNELVQILPDGVYYKKLSMKGTAMQLEGTAESINRVSELMRRFGDSDWFDEATLKSLKQNPTAGPQGSDFVLNVVQKTKQAGEEEEGA